MPLRDANRKTIRQPRYSACDFCRLRKIRCDRGVPCSICSKYNLDSCIYTPFRPTGRAKNHLLGFRVFRQSFATSTGSWNLIEDNESELSIVEADQPTWEIPEREQPSPATLSSSNSPITDTERPQNKLYIPMINVYSDKRALRKGEGRLASKCLNKIWRGISASKDAETPSGKVDLIGASGVLEPRFLT